MESCLPRVAAIHDLSGLGRCSLKVILPILAAMGVEPCPVPTAVLSSHTGGFGEPAMNDLTDFVGACMRHWQQLGTKLDCVYSGFLANERQAKQVADFFKAWPGARKVVDPVLGEDGRRYRTCTPGLIESMRALVTKADLITPNVTEADILLRMEYSAASLGRDKARSMLARLSEQGPRQVVITGAQVEPGRLCNIGYDRENSAFWRVDCGFLPVTYPGAGDAFASVLVGGLLTGDSLPLAMARATRFTELAGSTAFGYNTPKREGVLLEKALPWLVQRQTCMGYETL